LLSNALYWLHEFHVDGLRVDAVSSMLYLDDARTRGFRPNPLGGRENLAAIRFLRELNTEIRALEPSAFTVAEESMAFPLVSAPQDRGGLGFSMKWDMGWVSDTLRFLRLPWHERPAHHRDLTFGRVYAENERFVLSFSHDEAMPDKGSLFQQMFGSEAEKFAQLRLLALYQFTYPCKKLNFMGNEFAQRQAWDARGTLAWGELDAAPHPGIATLFSDLNALYHRNEVLATTDFTARNFEWIEPDDAAHSTIAYLRRRAQRYLIVALNFSNQPLPEYTVGVPGAGEYHVAMGSDDQRYGGSGGSQLLAAAAVEGGSGRFAHAVRIALAPLSGLILVPGSKGS